MQNIRSHYFDYLCILFSLICKKGDEIGAQLFVHNSRKRKTKKNIPAGVAHIHSTFNNTIVTITDLEGNVVSWASSGKQGVKGSKKSTPFAAGTSAEAAGRDAALAGMKKVKVEVKGLGAGREAAIRSLQTAGLEIESITDVTPIPHNGCRPPKRRRG